MRIASRDKDHKQECCKKCVKCVKHDSNHSTCCVSGRHDGFNNVACKTICFYLKCWCWWLLCVCWHYFRVEKKKVIYNCKRGKMKALAFRNSWLMLKLQVVSTPEVSTFDMLKALAASYMNNCKVQGFYYMKMTFWGDYSTRSTIPIRAFLGAIDFLILYCSYTQIYRV